MSLAFFLAKRIHFSKGDDTQRVSPPAVRFAIAGIAIGLAVMLLTVAIVVGFKNEVRNKIAGFGGHLELLAMTSNATFEKLPICYNDSLLDELRNMPNVASAEPFITKPAVLKTDSDFLSVVVKSADVEEREIRISETIARKLKLQTGDRVTLYFVQNNRWEQGLEFGADDVSIKSARLTVSGTYQTHFNEYDSQVILGNIGLLREKSGWDEDMASGIDIRVHDFDRIDDTYLDISVNCSQSQDRRGTAYMIQTLQQQNPQIFGWLDLLDTNVWVILGLMVVVSSFSMISGLLIIILERTQMIAILKALGCSNRQLRHTFIWMACFLTLQGLFWGNLFGLGLCAIQYFWHPVALDPENYYLEWVPIALNGWHVIALNIGTLLITLLMLVGPSALVAHISPSKALTTD
ncbi:MAG: ABC transporter permease [Bacteroidales bacterium]|nr:ABC transporter permease [Bacteroidales bacterium]